MNGPAPVPLDPAKFQDPVRTARGEARAVVALQGLATLWINTGTLCNLACESCYIESTPRNDRLAYITAAEVAGYLDEIARDRLPTRTVGFTGGEPFLNPDIVAMLDDAMGRGHDALVLTNAMRPMMKHADALLGLHRRHPGRLAVRVSIDHYDRRLHEQERGPRSWAPAMAGLRFLAGNGFAVHVAGRTRWGGSEAELRRGFARLFAAEGIPIDCEDPVRLVLFPEMASGHDVPEITEACWGILHRSPDSVMCASARMVVKRKDAPGPAVLACTLLPYDPRFELGTTLAAAARPVPLNHPYCARFCVLGGGSCGGG